VVGGVWKKCEKLLKKKKKRSSKFFRTGILEVGLCLKKKVAKYSGQPPPPKLISPYALGRGAKFISSPWAQKWLATALCTGIRTPSHFYTITNINVYPGFIVVQTTTNFFFQKLL
jgi:hypothetical protein